MLRKPWRPLVLGAALIVALIAESAAIVAQQEQIDDLRTQHIDFQGHLVEPSASGPSGPLVRKVLPARLARMGKTGRTGRTGGMGGTGGTARRARTGKTGKTLRPSHHRLRAGAAMGRLTTEPSRAAPPSRTRRRSALPWPGGGHSQLRTAACDELQHRALVDPVAADAWRAALC